MFQPVENLIGLGGGGGIGGSAATVLRKIGHHDRGIETALGHFVNVDKDFRIAAVEIDVLIKEHRRVAMRIEREVRGVPTAGATIVVRFAHKVGEKCARILAFEAFGVPLYAQNALALRAFHGFDDAVGSHGRDTQVRAGGVDRLVVEGIDQNPVAEQTVEQRIVHRGDAVRALGTRRLLRVFDEFALRMRCLLILVHRAPEGYGEHLHAATDAEHGNLPIVGAASQQQLEGVAHGIDAAQLRQRLLVHPERVQIGAAREQQAVGALQQFVDARQVGRRRNDERQTARTNHRFVVTRAKCATRFTEIARDDNERPAVGEPTRGLSIEFVQIIVHVLKCLRRRCPHGRGKSLSEHRIASGQ